MPVIDLSQFTEVTTANSAVKVQDFRLKVNYNKASFTFSNALFDELSLATNSLKQYNRETGPESERGVYFTVCPGNTGIWMKKKAGGEKGKTHKNERFVEGLNTFGITATKLDMILIGEVNNMPLYRVVVDGEAAPQVTEQEPQSELEVLPEPPVETDADATADGF
jgi:hypothetical protein